MSDATARLMTRHLTWAARVLGTVVFINVVLRALAAHVSLTVATSIILAVAIAALLCHFLFRIGGDVDEADDVSGAQWLRGAGWLLVAGIAISLVTGFVALGAFLAGRFLVALVVIGALYICLVFTDSLFTEILTANTPRGRKVAGFFGLKPRSIELIGTLLSAVIRLLLILVVLLPLLGPWGIFAADFFGVVRDVAFGFRVGDVTISVTSILSAAALLFVGILATRGAQSWLQTHFLPRTSLDPGLQNSVVDHLRLCLHHRRHRRSRSPPSASTCRRSRSSPARSRSASASACRRWCRISSPVSFCWPSGRSASATSSMSKARRARSAASMCARPKSKPRTAPA